MNIYQKQWEDEISIFIKQLERGNAMVDDNQAIVEYGQHIDNDPRFIVFDFNDDRLRDDHFCVQHSRPLNKYEFRRICNALQNNYNVMLDNPYLNESKKHINESEEEQYTHFAVNKFTNLIVDGWDYSGYDNEELRKYKRDYFIVDLEDLGFNPKIYKIVSKRSAIAQGLDYDDVQTGWSNTGVWPLHEEVRMQQSNIDYHQKAYEEHPDWFVE